MREKSIGRLQADERKRERRPVRIDIKTVILVALDVTDDEARESYWLKRGEYDRKQLKK